MKQIEDLKLLGLPALKLQHHLKRMQLKNATEALQGKKLSATIGIVLEDDENILKCLNFNEAEDVPPELQIFLESYCNRLAAEKHVLEQAMSELQEIIIRSN